MPIKSKKLFLIIYLPIIALGFGLPFIIFNFNRSIDVLTVTYICYMCVLFISIMVRMSIFEKVVYKKRIKERQEKIKLPEYSYMLFANWITFFFILLFLVLMVIFNTTSII